MLKELQDGHTNLISSYDVSRYWIWEQYPVNYDERLIDEHYLAVSIICSEPCITLIINTCGLVTQHVPDGITLLADRGQECTLNCTSGQTTNGGLKISNLVLEE